MTHVLKNSSLQFTHILCKNQLYFEKLFCFTKKHSNSQEYTMRVCFCSGSAQIQAIILQNSCK